MLFFICRCKVWCHVLGDHIFTQRNLIHTRSCSPSWTPHNNAALYCAWRPILSLRNPSRSACKSTSWMFMWLYQFLLGLCDCSYGLREREGYWFLFGWLDCVNKYVVILLLSVKIFENWKVWQIHFTFLLAWLQQWLQQYYLPLPWPQIAGGNVTASQCSTPSLPTPFTVLPLDVWLKDWLCIVPSVWLRYFLWVRQWC